ncbi:hypothetical protein ACE6H2_019182 [Prunus campanulata]
MANSDVDSATISHVAAMPFHGWGHINPMMNLCKLLASKNPQLLITFVVTEEWLGFISSDPKPDNIWLASISNVIPPKRLKATNFPGFYEAVMTKMEAPFERLLDRLEPPVSAIIADIEVPWGVRFGIRRNIPVSLFWTMSTTFLSMLQHFNVFSQNKNIPLEFFDCGDQIPGISSTDLADLGEMFKGNDPKVMKLALECISWVPKAQEEIAELVKRFMDLSSDGKEMRKRAKEMRKRAKEHSDLCHRAIAKGGSYDTNLDNFIRDIGKAATF